MQVLACDRDVEHSPACLVADTYAASPRDHYIEVEEKINLIVKSLYDKATLAKYHDL